MGSHKLFSLEKERQNIGYMIIQWKKFSKVLDFIRLTIFNKIVNLYINKYKYSTKLSLETMLNKGIEQIKNKGYHKPYQNKNLIFVSIATKPKEIACKIEKYNK